MTKTKQAILLLGFQLFAACSFAQMPSAKMIFTEMFKATDSTRNISYEVHSSYMDGTGGKDSLLRFASTVMARKEKSGAGINYYFRVQSAGIPDTAEYKYKETDGVNHYKHNFQAGTDYILDPFALDELSKLRLPFVIEKSFLPEMIQTAAPKSWLDHLNAMKVYDTEKNWVIQWEEDHKEDEFMAQHQLVIDKKTYLISEIHRRASWHGVPFKTDITVQNIHLN